MDLTRFDKEEVTLLPKSEGLRWNCLKKLTLTYIISHTYEIEKNMIILNETK